MKNVHILYKSKIICKQPLIKKGINSYIKPKIIESNGIKEKSFKNNIEFVFNKELQKNNFENKKRKINFIEFKNKIFINIFILIILMFPILTEKSITIKIKGVGLQKLLNASFTQNPSVYFQETLLSITNNAIEITGTESDENEFILLWDSTFDNCDHMFDGLENIIEINLSDFPPIQCKSMKYMFNNNINLKKITFEEFDTSLCSNMNYLFSNCHSLDSLNLDNFDTSSVTNFHRMFYNCTSLKSLDLSSFDTSSVSTMKELFSQCSSLDSLNLDCWDTSQVTTMTRMFNGCTSLKSLNLNHFNTGLVTQMDSMFDSCRSLEFLEISSFVTSSVSTMANMFAKCENLISVDVSHFDTSNVINMKNMFTSCKSLTSIDVSHFNTEKVTNMNKMFDGCTKLLYVDVSNFNTENVSDLGKMFSNCNSLTSLDVSHFNTEKVENLQEMFNNCNSLTSIDLTNFYTALVTNMEKMFYYCASISSLDLSNFNTLNVINMISMLEGCSNLTYINLFNFEENSNLNYTNIFLDINDNLVYCINNEENAGNIISELKVIMCVSNDCDSNWIENKKNKLKEKMNDISVLTDQCAYKEIKEINADISLTQNSNISIYSYELTGSDEGINKNTNLTYIEFSQEDIDFIYEYFNLDKDKDKIYILMADMLSNDSRTATSDYNFVVLLENGTQLNFSNINKDFYIDVYVPIRDLDLANFDYAQYFEDIGYDIYNSSSDFYHDFCTPASSGENDIILKDRQKDIFPNNVTLCKEGCQYKSVNIDEQRIVCECNLNNNISHEDNNHFMKEEEDDGNFIT